MDRFSKLDGSPLIRPSLGATFAIPPHDWRILNNFCYTVAVMERPDPDSPTGSPGIPAPVSQPCRDAFMDWIDNGYDDFVNRAGALAPVCQSIATSLAGLEQTVAALEPNAPLTPAEQSSASAILTSFAATASQQAAIFQAQASTLADIAEFVTEFEQPVIAWMEDWWGPGEQPDAATLADGTGLMRGSWGALIDDLRGLSVPPEQVSIALLLSLELASAVSGWTALGHEAQSFAATAPPIGYGGSPPA